MPTEEDVKGVEQKLERMDAAATADDLAEKAVEEARKELAIETPLSANVRDLTEATLQEQAIKMANATTIDLQLLDDAQIQWQSQIGANVYVNGQEQMEVNIAANTTASVLRELQFEGNQTVLFQLQVNRGSNFPTTVPLQFEVRNYEDKAVLWSTNVPADGNVNGPTGARL